jgi:anti-anti-sigma factor
MEEEPVVEITSEDENAVVTFKAASITDVESITSASKRIREFVGKTHPGRIVFDFEQVKFFSSQVLGLLLEVRAELQPYDAEVVISAIDPQLHRVFRITNLDKVFSFFADTGSALKAANTN